MRWRWATFVAISSCGCAADLLSKSWIFGWSRGPGNQGEWWIVEPYFGIQHALNQGALWGLGQGKVALFASLSVLAVCGIVFWVFFGGAVRDRWLNATLGLIVGGILGNLYDRLGMWGGQNADGSPIYAVRDWILFRYGEWVWPNFNLADCWLVVGAILLAWHSLLTPASKSDCGEPDRVEP
jgi:signal peptidase II